MFIRLQIRDPMARFVAHDEYLQAGFARDSLFLVEAKRRGSRLEIIVERNDDTKFCLIFKGMLFLVVRSLIVLSARQVMTIYLTGIASPEILVNYLIPD